MNSLVKVFSNFKEFYSEINGATLTGAIDVIVVEQPDGTYACSPFHVRFGKLGVLRSREKVVDIEINGEPVNIHMKLGESGEAFFVEECSDDDEEIPENLATSPIPLSEFSKYEEANQFSNASDDIQIPLLPRRNSIDLSKESEEADKKYENQISDYAQRRHTDNTMERSDLAVYKKEYTTQKLRQEWAEHEEIIPTIIDISEEITSQKTSNDKETTTENTNKNLIEDESRVFRPIVCELNQKEHEQVILEEENDEKLFKEETKSKKKRRKKSALKKKNAQRKNSGSSSSAGSLNSEQHDQENETATASITANSSTDESPIIDEINPIILEKKEITCGGNDDVNNDELNESMEINSRFRELDIHFFSDTEVGNATSPRGSRPSTPVQSDTEFEVSQREKNDSSAMSNSASWKWGELPTQPDDIKENITDDSKQAQRNSMLSGMFSFMKQTKKLRKNAPEGLYLSELDAEGMDPEVAALYFAPSNNTTLNISQNNQQRQTTGTNTNEEDRESGNGTSLPQSPNSMEGAKNSDSDYEEGKPADKYLDFVAMSLCGYLETGAVSDEEFERHVIKFNDVCQNPSIFSSPNLVVRLNGKYYNWSAACPIVMTMITFQKPLPNETVELLMSNSSSKSSDIITVESLQEPRRPYYNFFGLNLLRRGQTKSTESKDLTVQGVESPINIGTQTSRSVSPESKQDDNTISSKPMNISIVSDNSESSDKDLSITKQSTEKYKKSLRLSTDQIECLNLKNGVNEVVFSVTTAYQGTSRCKCYLFKWKHNDKVVISDIDGTITKSDVLGHILPMVGKDWAQIGVAQLFSKIEENGYKLLYLSARAIGQSRATREYLRSIRQGDVKLPDGPLLLNPTSLISAFHREVIERKPEQFKIACLSDIQALFPNKNPFYAGYGNRINDVWAYRAVGIPIMRIFTINTKGELKHELTQTFQSTYCSMAYIVDQLFPPIREEDYESSIEYSNFNYWRDPVSDIDIDDLSLNVSNPTTNNNNKSLASIPEN